MPTLSARWSVPAQVCFARTRFAMRFRSIPLPLRGRPPADCPAASIGTSSKSDGTQNMVSHLHADDAADDTLRRSIP